MQPPVKRSALAPIRRPGRKQAKLSPADIAAARAAVAEQLAPLARKVESVTVRLEPAQREHLLHQYESISEGLRVLVQKDMDRAAKRAAKGS